MRGLGVLSTTATGVEESASPICVTPAELAEANSKCTAIPIRGIGETRVERAPMSGRLASFSPCAIVGLPVCPTPKCIDQYTAGLIAECIAGTSSNPDFDCTSLYTYALSQLPYCGDVLPPMPGCITPDVQSLVSYCQQYPNMDGPNKALNAGCWAVKHDPKYWAKLQTLGPCAPAQQPYPGGAGPMTPAAPPSTAGTSGASTTGMWGILALLAAAGGGYYMYRKYKH